MVPGGVAVDRKCMMRVFKVVALAAALLVWLTMTVSLMLVDMSTGVIVVLSLLAKLAQWYGSGLSIARNDGYNG